jgi:DNA-binding HxlR family transcriptional regulator
MARTKDYSHFCPVARSLEVIGEKWSLLVVRDLLRGPQRFTDLHRFMGGITPKWLTARLRELEAAGIVERDQQEGRREVWYRLTEKGRELAPVLSALAVWGMDHAMRPATPDDAFYPEQYMMGLVNYLIRKRIRPDQPLTWQFRFGATPWMLSYQGERWRSRAGEAEADLAISGAPDDWTALLVAPRAERAPALDAMTYDGPKHRITEFRRIMSGPLPARRRAPAR